MFYVIGKGDVRNNAEKLERRYGLVASQQSDSGTWIATRNTLIANSRVNGRHVYLLQKKNHPKTRDPMLVIDGRAFVAFYRKSPW